MAQAIETSKTGGLRWWVIGLIALAAVINYIDRQALGVSQYLGPS